MCSKLVASLFLLITIPASAQTLVAGEYVTDGGWGTLTLSAGAKGATHFTIESVGANGHSCSLEGDVRNGKATLEGLDETEICEVTMIATSEGIEVQSNDACRIYCGARAGVDGLYVRPAPECRSAAVASTRKKFKQLYDAKKFAEARGTLEPLLTKCESTLDWLTVGRIRNDLAVTLHKLRNFTACRAALDPLSDDAALSDAEIREKYPPSDADSVMPIVRATRTNLRLCGGTGSRE
jgi:hypothetical protein